MLSLSYYHPTVLLQLIFCSNCLRREDIDKTMQFPHYLQMKGPASRPAQNQEFSVMMEMFNICTIQYVVATGYSALQMWLVWLKNSVFNSI